MSQTPASRPVLNDRYQIQGRIGRGGMADVFLARDLLLDRPVAVKVLFPEYATDPSFVERFRREAQAAANLTHPNIVGVYDWGQQGSTYFIVMEYVNGRSLAEIIRTEGPLDAKRACDVTSEVAAALGFAHRSGVVHRDIKPANILVSNQGTVKVADFGIARALNAAADQGLTQAGAVMGTATYFSPEQAQGAPLDTRSDLYSLGVVLYEMLCGRPPFSGDNPVSIAYKQVHDPPSPPSQLRPDLPEGVEAVTLKLLAKNPANRYANADDLRTDLRRFRDTGSVRVTRGAELPTLAVPGLAAAAGAGAADAAAASDAPTVAGYPLGASTRTMARTGSGGPPSAPLPPVEEPRRRVGWFVFAILATLAVIAASAALLYNRLHSTSATQTVTVDNYIGQPATDAGTKIKALGLTPVTTLVTSPDQATGLVISQSPVAGATLKIGSTLALTVSQGKGNVTLPDLTGKSQTDAQTALTKLGLPFSVTLSDSPTVPQGTVISQTPAPGDVSLDTTKVVLTVSSGPGKVPIDNVVGLDQTRAAAILGKNFTVDVAYEASDSVPQNNVIRTVPAVLTVEPRGSNVTIVVSGGPQPVTVPSVQGFTEVDARNAIRKAGLIEVVVYVTLPFGSPDDGKVISQLPVGGNQVPKGNNVTINVGRAGPAPTTTLPPTTTTAAPPTTAKTTTTATH